MAELVGSTNPVFKGKLSFANPTGPKYAGDAILSSGVATITITGITSSDRATATPTSSAGTLGVALQCVCTTDTLTITSKGTTNTTQTLDTSTVFYTVYGVS